MANVMYCLHYRCNVPKVLPCYVPYRRSHSVLYKSFPDDTPESEILEYFKKAHEDKVNNEINKLKDRIVNLEKRVKTINDILSMG